MADGKNENQIDMNMVEELEIIKGNLNFEWICEPKNCGYITEVGENRAKCVLSTIPEMKIDSEGLVNSSFIYTAAKYCANAAINEKFMTIIASRVSYLAPLLVGENVDFEATARFEESRKREVHVVGMVHDIKVFDGVFQILILEEHVLKSKEKMLIRERNKKQDAKDEAKV